MNENDTRRASGTVAPPPRIAIAVREMLLGRGGLETAAHLGVSRSTAERIAGRLPCRRGSILLAARALGMELDDGR